MRWGTEMIGVLFCAPAKWYFASERVGLRSLESAHGVPAYSAQEQCSFEVRHEVTLAKSLLTGLE